MKRFQSNSLQFVELSFNEMNPLLLKLMVIVSLFSLSSIITFLLGFINNPEQSSLGRYSINQTNFDIGFSIPVLFLDKFFGVSFRVRPSYHVVDSFGFDVLPINLSIAFKNNEDQDFDYQELDTNKSAVYRKKQNDFLFSFPPYYFPVTTKNVSFSIKALVNTYDFDNYYIIPEVSIFQVKTQFISLIFGIIITIFDVYYLIKLFQRKKFYMSQITYLLGIFSILSVNILSFFIHSLDKCSVFFESLFLLIYRTFGINMLLIIYNKFSSQRRNNLFIVLFVLFLIPLALLECFVKTMQKTVIIAQGSFKSSILANSYIFLLFIYAAIIVYLGIKGYSSPNSIQALCYGSFLVLSSIFSFLIQFLLFGFHRVSLYLYLIFDLYTCNIASVVFLKYQSTFNIQYESIADKINPEEDISLDLEFFNNNINFNNLENE